MITEDDPLSILNTLRDRIESICKKGAGMGGPNKGPDGLSYKHLSRLVGLHHDGVGDFMRGRKGLSLKSLERLCLILDLQLVPGEYLPKENVQSFVYRKSNTVLNHRLKEMSNA